MRHKTPSCKKVRCTSSQCGKPVLEMWHKQLRRISPAPLRQERGAPPRCRESSLVSNWGAWESTLGEVTRGIHGKKKCYQGKKLAGQQMRDRIYSQLNEAVHREISSESSSSAKFGMPKAGTRQNNGMQKKADV